MGMKLLIIHPDDLFRSRLVERMRLENQKVFETSIKAEAEDIIQRENLDVVLLGVMGSHQDRLGFLKMIRKVQPFTEVIFLTAAEHHSFDGAIKAMQLGAFDDLLLPIDFNALFSRIQEAVKRKKVRIKVMKKEIGKGREGHIVKRPSESETRLDNDNP
jgi:two-component system, NtrC family, response regulator HydG